MVLDRETKATVIIVAMVFFIISILIGSIFMYHFYNSDFKMAEKGYVQELKEKQIITYEKVWVKK